MYKTGDNILTIQKKRLSIRRKKQKTGKKPPALSYLCFGGEENVSGQQGNLAYFVLKKHKGEEKKKNESGLE